MQDSPHLVDHRLPVVGIARKVKDGAADHGIEHPVIANAGHFLQEDAGEELAEAIVRFLAR